MLTTLGARGVHAGAPPPNDDCGQPTEINAEPYADSLSTTAATTDASDPTPMCPIESSNPRGKSVWYVFDATAAGMIVADTFDSDYDTILTAYTGDCGALELVPGACSDDDPLDGAQSRVTFAVSPGVAYRFMASAFHDDGGTLQFHFTFSGANTPTPSSGANTPTPSSGANTPTTSGTAVATPPTTPTPSPIPSLAGDANCDGRKTAADITAVITLIVAGERAPCGRDDANGDGMLNVADVVATVGALFTP